MSLLKSPSMNQRFWQKSIALPILFLGFAVVAQAADIRDEAGLFSADTVKKAKEVLSRAEKDANIQITVETVDSLNGVSIDTAVPDHAKKLGIRGLFVLIAKKESKIEASASREFAKFFPVTRRRSIENAFVGEFKNRQFDQGLIKGVEAIDSAVSQAKSEAGGSFAPTPVAARGPQAPAPAPRVPGPVPVPARRSFGIPSVIGIILLVLAGIVILRLIGGLFGAGRSTYYGPNMGPGGRPMGGPGYGGPGYGGGGYGGGGGGFMSSLFGGIGGAMAGNWLYDQFRGNRHSQYDQPAHYDQGASPLPPDQPTGPEWTSDGGSDWSGGGGGGSDWGTGGGGGGSDWGGGGGGGGDWGGGGGGGGDWGGSTGGGDWGGGGSGGDGGGSW